MIHSCSSTANAKAASCADKSQCKTKHKNTSQCNTFLRFWKATQKLVLQNVQPFKFLAHISLVFFLISLFFKNKKVH